MKVVHALYRIAPKTSETLTKWATQLALTVQLSCKKRFGFHVFTQKGSSMSPYQGFKILLSRSRGYEWIQDFLKSYKYPSSMLRVEE
jgi:hypothetical protein